MKWLKYIPPNLITLFRLFFGGWFLYIIFGGNPISRLPAITVLFIAAMVSDAIDGPIACLCNATSKFGAALDKYSDWIFTTMAMIGFQRLGLLPWLPIIIASIIIIIINFCEKKILKKWPRKGKLIYLRTPLMTSFLYLCSLVLFVLLCNSYGIPVKYAIAIYLTGSAIVVTPCILIWKNTRVGKWKKKRINKLIRRSIPK